MVGKQLNAAKYKQLQSYLSQNAHRDSYCPIFEVSIAFNDEHYAMFLQLDRHRKVYALYALRFSGGAHFQLITENLVLSALMELLLFQSIP